MALRRQLLLWFQWWYTKALAALSAAPAGTLPLTGVLGFAAVVYTLRQRRGPDSRRGAPAASVQGTAQPAGHSSHAPPPQSLQKGPPTSSQQVGRLRSQLAGVKLVTISAPGVLFQEATAEQLEEGALVLPEALEVLQELCQAVHMCIVAHVLSDIGEAVIKGSLEAQGLLGSGPRQLRPHRVLCCSTAQGKESILRQLEPGLHIDGDPVTVRNMQRFLPRLVLVGKMPEPSQLPAGRVSHAASLMDIFKGH